MLVKILTVNEKGVVVPGLSCATEPYLKAISKRYKGTTYINVLCFLHYMTHPYSPYNNFPSSEKETDIYKEYPGDYKLTDKEVVEALKELNKRYDSIQKRSYQATCIAVDEIIKFISTMAADGLSAGKDGNITDYKNAVKDMPTLLKAVTQIEQEYEESLQVKFRGGLDEAYDEQFDD